MSIGVVGTGREDAGKPSAPIRIVFREDGCLELVEEGGVARPKANGPKFKLEANTSVDGAHRGINRLFAMKPVIALGPKGPRNFPDPSHQLRSPGTGGKTGVLPVRERIGSLGVGPSVARKTLKEGTPTECGLVT